MIPVYLLGSAIWQIRQHLSRQITDDWQEFKDYNDAVEILMACQDLIKAEERLKRLL